METIEEWELGFARFVSLEDKNRTWTSPRHVRVRLLRFPWIQPLPFPPLVRMSHLGNGGDARLERRMQTHSACSPLAKRKAIAAAARDFSRPPVDSIFRYHLHRAILVFVTASGGMCAGEMWKRGGGYSTLGMKSWKRRYFVIDVRWLNWELFCLLCSPRPIVPFAKCLYHKPFDTVLDLGETRNAMLVGTM